MKDTLQVLLNANVDKLFLVFGILLLVVAVVGKVKDWFDPGPVGRALAVFIGGGLTIVGLTLALMPRPNASDNSNHNPAVQPVPVSPVSVPDTNSSPQTPQPRFNLAGYYRGIAQTTTGTAAGTSIWFDWNLQQEGDDVTASYRNQLGDAGTLSARIAGSTMNGSIISRTAPRGRCNFESTLTRGGATISGTIACVDGTRANFTANR